MDWIRLAEIFDAHRIASRGIFVAMMLFVVFYTFYVTEWYFNNFAEFKDHAGAMYGASGFLGVTIPALFKFTTDYATKYLQGGFNWIERHEKGIK